jgi:hypothetical protein
MSCLNAVPSPILCRFHKCKETKSERPKGLSSSFTILISQLEARFHSTVFQVLIADRLSQADSEK